MSKAVKKKNIVPLLVISFAFIILGLLFENLYLRPYSKSDIAKNIQWKLHDKQTELRHELNRFSQSLLRDSFYIDKYEELIKLTRKEFYVFGFENDSLTFWNSNKIILPAQFKVLHKNRIIELPNAYALWDSISVGNKVLFGIYPIQYQYRIENHYIKSYFQPELGIPEGSVIYLSNLGRTISIKSDKGNALFYLDISDVNTGNEIYKSLGLCAYLFSLVLLWFALLYKISYNRNQRFKNIFLALMYLTSFIVIWFVGLFDYPVLLNYSELFSPTVFAMPGVFSNLGLIFVFSILWGMLGVAFQNSFNTGSKTFLKSVFYGIFLSAVFFGITELFIDIIINSVINFQLQLLKSVDIYSLLAYLSYLLLYAGWFMVLDKIIHKYLLNESFKGKHQYYFNAAILATGLTYSLIFNMKFLVPFAILIFIIATVYFVRIRKSKSYNFLSRFILIVLFSFLGYNLYWQTHETTDKSKEETLLGNLASSALKERDPVLEINLVQQKENIEQDYRVKEILVNDNIDVDKLQEYLRRFYLGEFWRNYDIQVIVCWPESNLFIEEQSEGIDCYNYFEGMLNEIGHEIADANVFFLNNFNGRVNYFIRITFDEGSDDEVSLYIDLESRTKAKGIGYPELLSDNNIDLSSIYDGYSFARYVDGSLVNYTGDYQYNSLDDWFSDSLSVVKFNGYIHRIYKASDSEKFVLSKPEVNAIDVTLFLVYLFLYMFTLTYLGISIYNLAINKKKPVDSLAQRIRRSVIFILLLSFVLVGATSIYFNVRQYKNKQLEVLTEKNKSILVALEGFVGGAEKVGDIDVGSLTLFLQELSNTLYIDINFYDPNGSLLASSRPAIFQREIISRKISPASYYQLKYDQKPVVISNESLVGLNYLSFYQPLSNWNSELLGYINLPYFVSSDALSNDVSDFIVVLLNIYLIFVILALIITVFLTREIVRPLLLVREKIAGFRLQGTNEKIDYSGNDEVAQLVEDYNRLIEEVQQSAVQLAASERSMAWRQMARQVAHEIKNPLTPMKLSIQHLQRAKAENNERFNEFFKKTTQTLVEQIDNLSRIASEFSSFSKMPESKLENVNLVERANLAVNLFRETPDVSIEMSFDAEDIWVKADREQLNQVFNNLIKNAIQAVPAGMQGKVHIRLKKENNLAIIEIIDNGKGIPPTLHSKLFEPNFTTKSSGMGLGLAIVKNILQNFGGTIEFTTKELKGSTFIVKLPLLSNLLDD